MDETLTLTQGRFQITATSFPKSVSLRAIEAARSALALATEPVTCSEVLMHIRSTTGYNPSLWTAKDALSALVFSGAAQCRLENQSELAFRTLLRSQAAGKRVVPGRPAMLYFLRADGRSMPERTSEVILRGVTYATSAPEIRKSNDRARSLRRSVATQGRLAKGSAQMQTGTRFDRIETRLNSLEQSDLRDRVIALEATIATLIKTLS